MRLAFSCLSRSRKPEWRGDGGGRVIPTLTVKNHNMHRACNMKEAGFSKWSVMDLAQSVLPLCCVCLLSQNFVMVRGLFSSLHQSLLLFSFSSVAIIQVWQIAFPLKNMASHRLIWAAIACLYLLAMSIKVR